MQTIVCGPSKERVIRTGLLFVMVVGFAAAYLWDGYRGYPRQNARELLRLLGLSDAGLPRIDPGLTSSAVAEAMQSVPVNGSVSALAERLGEPGAQHGDDLYFLGPGGWLKVQLRGGTIAAMTWIHGGKTESDQRWQRWIGYALCVVGVVVGIQLFRVSTARLILSDSGLQARSASGIPIEAVTALRVDPSSKSGCIDLDYSLDGKEHKLRLDPYVYRNLTALTSAICERRGFPHP